MSISPALQKAMEAKNIDISLSIQMLEHSNHLLPERPRSLSISGQDERIIDITTLNELSLPRKQAETAWHQLGLPFPLQDFSTLQEHRICFSRQQLERIGYLLFPCFSQGILNGGSATSYLDHKKNQSLQPALFPHFAPYFANISQQYAGLPKSLLPAFLYKDGRLGPGFLALKLRNLDLSYMRYCQEMKAQSLRPGELHYPIFQMTSDFSTEPIAQSITALRSDPFLSAQMQKATIPEAVQPLLAALSHSQEGLPRHFFTEAYGKPMNPLALPGGHGQSFQVLSTIYNDLYAQGIRYVTMGNIDNLGYTYNPLMLAYLALSGIVAMFEFSPRTPIDQKGGILVLDENKRFTCADLGVAVPLGQADAAPSVLFNCAIGWFKLDYLIDNLSRIIQHIPLRVSDQQKDAGNYAQGEYITWEAISLFEPAAIMKVPKAQRFLAAKTLSETLIQSGIEERAVLSHYPEAQPLIEGMQALLAQHYKLSPLPNS